MSSSLPHPIYRIAPPQSRKISLKKQIRLVRELGKHYGVVVRFFKRESLTPGAGCIRVTYNSNGPVYTIYIHYGTREAPNDYLQTFFHEMGHVYCYRTGKWLAYHSQIDYTTFEEQIKALRGFISTGFRAECWIDTWASKELKKWFPRYSYDFPYHQPDAKQWYEDNYLAEFRKELARLTNKLKTLTK